MKFIVGDRVSWYIRPEIQDPERREYYLKTDRMVGTIRSLFEEFMVVGVNYLQNGVPTLQHYSVDLNNTSLRLEKEDDYKSGVG